MTAPQHQTDPIRSMQLGISGWRLLKKNCLLMHAKLSGTQRLISFTQAQLRRHDLTLVERRKLNQSLVSCIKSVERLANNLRKKRFQLDNERLRLVVEQNQLISELSEKEQQAAAFSQVKEQLEILTERHRKLSALDRDKTELYRSRNLMLWCKLINMTQEFVSVKMRTKSIEYACEELRRRNEQLQRKNWPKRQEVERNGVLNQVYCLIRTCIRRLWDCVASMADVTNLPGGPKHPCHSFSIVLAFF